MRTAKSLIRLDGCPGWSESSLGAQPFCFVMSRLIYMLYRTEQTEKQLPNHKKREKAPWHGAPQNYHNSNSTRFAVLKWLAEITTGAIHMLALWLWHFLTIFVASTYFYTKIEEKQRWVGKLYRPRQANLVLIAYASTEGSGEPAHPRSLVRTSATRSYKQWVKRNLQTESQIPGPSEWLGMRS